MAIVTELQIDALKNDSDVLSLLRKAHVIARKLKLDDFDSWIICELNGYKPKEKFPAYRTIIGDLRGWNPYNGWISVLVPYQDIQDAICIRKIPNSIPSLQSIISINGEAAIMLLSGSQNTILSEATQTETKFSLFIAKNQLENIVEQVKNGILEWSLVLEENGVFGENMKFTCEEQEIAKNSTTINNYTSYFYGNISDSQIQQGTDNSEQTKE